VKPFTARVAKALFEAGCKEISFGVESFDDDVLMTLGKGTYAVDNITAMRLAKEAGMTVRVLFMIRTPGQTNLTVDKNIHQLERYSDLWDIIACSTFMPLPGSEIWNFPKKFGVKILSKDLDLYNVCFFGPDGVNEIPKVIEFTHRNNREIDKETEKFRNFLIGTGKLNMG
jgi:radical SAM superfamily enzyme YgiQ (UPF0313 family)